MTQTGACAKTTPDLETLAQAPRQAGPLVAVIEDDEGIRETLRFMLEDEGYRVVEAVDGVTGCDLLRNSTERLIAVVDHKMPRMDGCDVLELAANDEQMRAQHIFIFVTASPRRAEEDCGEALAELDVPLVPKPFELDELLGVVADAAKRLARS